MSTKTAIAREEIAKYLKSLNGKKVRQKDLVDYLLKHSGADLTQGTLNGVFYRLERGNGIPGVQVFRENGAVYYYWDPTSGISFAPDSPMGKIKKMVIDMENNLRKENISIFDLNSEERKFFDNFLNHFQKMKELFETNEKEG